MRMHLTPAALALLLVTLSSCATLRDGPKYQFADGVYRWKTEGRPAQRVYLDNEEDSLYMYAPEVENLSPGDNKEPVGMLPQRYAESQLPPSRFRQSSLDVDFLTIPIKYRPSLPSFPRQMNANLNGAVYTGWRNDVYSVKYAKSPRGYQRITRHQGFSAGLFTGLGNTAINPSVTNDLVDDEYDGVVWLKGLAFIAGIDRITLGLALGYDHLVDGNRGKWIYQGRPWVGLAFGLNLN